MILLQTLLEHPATALVTLGVSLLGAAITRGIEKRQLRKSGKLKD